MLFVMNSMVAENCSSCPSPTKDKSAGNTQVSSRDNVSNGADDRQRGPSADGASASSGSTYYSQHTQKKDFNANNTSIPHDSSVSSLLDSSFGSSVGLGDSSHHQRAAANYPGAAAAATIPEEYSECTYTSEEEAEEERMMDLQESGRCSLSMRLMPGESSEEDDASIGDISSIQNTISSTTAATAVYPERLHQSLSGLTAGGVDYSRRAIKSGSTTSTRRRATSFNPSIAESSMDSSAPSILQTGPTKRRGSMSAVPSKAGRHYHRSHVSAGLLDISNTYDYNVGSKVEKEVKLHTMTNHTRRKSMTNAATSNRRLISVTNGPHQTKKVSSSTVLKGALLFVAIIILSTLGYGIYYHIYQQKTTLPPVPFWKQPQYSDITLTPRYVALLGKLKSQRNIPNKIIERFHDKSSPAHTALAWLAADDPLQLDFHETQTAVVVQRLALATIYFATNGPKWQQSQSWMTEASECDWHGVQCEILEQSDWFSPGNSAYAGALEEEELEQPKPEVTRLSLSGNHLAGTIPDEVHLLSHLISLDLSYNDLIGTLPQDADILGHYMRLTDLQLQHNRFSGSIPAALGANLITRQLLLHHNQFRAEIPSSLGNLLNLRHLALNHNQLTGSIPNTLRGMKHIQQLELNNNQLTGELPFAICFLSKLLTLRLNNNAFVGTLPSELAADKQLEIVNLGNNQFQGQIPDIFLELTALRELRLSHNQFSKHLPTSLGNLSNLRHLTLDDNALSGGIPTEWGGMSMLESLLISHNQLEGTIPVQFGKLSYLVTFEWHGNELPAELPKKIKRRLLHLNHRLSHDDKKTGERNGTGGEQGQKKQDEVIQLLSNADSPQRLQASGTPQRELDSDADNDEEM